jgi:hypothetical protein
MIPITPRDLLVLHLTGYALLILQAGAVAYFGTTLFYVVGLGAGIAIPPGAVMGHLFLSFLLLTLFPGQTFWSLRVFDRHLQPRTIVGALSEFEAFHTPTRPNGRSGTHRDRKR